MQKRCLKCGIMIDVPEMDTLNPDNRADVVCPQCGESYQYHMGQLKRPRPQYDLGQPENRIEKRKYAPIQNSGSDESGSATPGNAAPENAGGSPADSGNSVGVSSSSVPSSDNPDSSRSNNGKRDPFAVPGPEDKHRGFLRKLFGW